MSPRSEHHSLSLLPCSRHILSLILSNTLTHCRQEMICIFQTSELQRCDDTFEGSGVSLTSSFYFSDCLTSTARGVLLCLAWLLTGRARQLHGLGSAPALSSSPVLPSCKGTAHRASYCPSGDRTPESIELRQCFLRVRMAVRTVQG